MTYDRELRTEAAHALTHNQEVWSDRGYAVVTAGGLSEGDTDFELDVGPYDVLVGDTDETSVGPTTLSVNAPTDNPYWLVVYVDSEGLQTEQGPEGEVFVGDQSVVASNADVREITSPAPPTLADIGPVTVLGKVLVTSSGVTNSLIDDRVFQSERVFESVDANEVTAEQLLFDNKVGSEGDFWAVGPSFSYPHRTNRLSISSDTYQTDDNYSRFGVLWDEWAPDEATTAIQAHIATGGTGDQAFVRLRNTTDSEDAFEIGPQGHGVGVFDTFEYSPTTTSDDIEFQIEAKRDDASTLTVNSYSVSFGVIL